MFEVTVRTDIAAPLHRVWSVLASLSNYDSWNPLIVQVDARASTSGAGRDEVSTGVRLAGGDLRPGDPITIHVALESGQQAIDVTVSRAVREREFGWRFVERSRWLYRGEHVFRLEDAGEGVTRLIDRERFWGILVPFRRAALAGRITASMTLMGNAL